MNPWLAILIVAGTTGIVVYLTTRRPAATVTISRTTHSDDPEN